MFLMCGLLQEVPPVDLSAAKATPPVRSVSADLKFEMSKA